MGRELKRVPLDFQWPMNKIWEGYLNPHYKKCPDCSNGETAARSCFGTIVSRLMLAGFDSAKGTYHPYLVEMGCDKPSPDMMELTSGLAGRAPSVMGHDAIDKWVAVNKIILAAGLTKEWGICQTCKGEAIDPEVKEKYEAWERYDPMLGVGYQLWETTSEGSPISPVFPSLEELCEYSAENCGTFGSNRATAEEWKDMLSDGFVHHTQGNMTFI